MERFILNDHHHDTRLLVVSRAIENTPRAYGKIRRKCHLLVFVLTENAHRGRNETKISANYIKTVTGQNVEYGNEVAIRPKFIVKNVEVLENGERKIWEATSHVASNDLRIVFCEGKVTDGNLFFFMFMVKIQNSARPSQSQVTVISAFSFVLQPDRTWKIHTLTFSGEDAPRVPFELSRSATHTPQGIAVWIGNNFQNFPFASLERNRLVPLETSRIASDSRGTPYFDVFTNQRRENSLRVPNDAVREIGLSGDIPAGQYSPTFNIDESFDSEGFLKMLRILSFTKGPRGDIVTKVYGIIIPGFPANSEVYHSVNISQECISIVMYVVHDSTLTHVLPYKIPHINTVGHQVGSMFLPKLDVPVTHLHNEVTANEHLSRSILMSNEDNETYMRDAMPLAADLGSRIFRQMQGDILACVPVSPLGTGKEVAFILKPVVENGNHRAVFFHDGRIVNRTYAALNPGIFLRNADEFENPYHQMHFVQCDYATYLLCGDEKFPTHDQFEDTDVEPFQSAVMLVRPPV